MFGIGSTELLIIIVVFMIFMGPERIPKVARDVGKVMGELKKITRDIKREMKTLDKDVKPPTHPDELNNEHRK